MTSPVYVIHSNWSLTYLHEFLKCYGPTSSIGLLTAERRRNEETELTFALLKDDLYANLVRQGFDRPSEFLDFYIEPFQPRPSDYPKANEGPDLFVVLPRELDADTCRHKLTTWLRAMATFGLLTWNIRNLNIPQSRSTNTHLGSAFLRFTDDKIPIEATLRVRILLHYTSWYDTRTSKPVRCYWSDHRKNRNL